MGIDIVGIISRFRFTYSDFGGSTVLLSNVHLGIPISFEQA